MWIGFEVKKTSRKLRKSVFYITVNELYRGPCLNSLWKCEAVQISRVRRTNGFVENCARQSQGFQARLGVLSRRDGELVVGVQVPISTSISTHRLTL